MVFGCTWFEVVVISLFTLASVARPLRFRHIDLYVLRFMDPSCYYYSLSSVCLGAKLMHSFNQDKPYTAVTVQIERLCKEEYDVEDLSGIIDLIEVVKLQSSGPTEAARAIRKKL